MRGSPIVLYPDPPHGVATYPPGATFGPRQMREYEFVWLISGDAEYIVDGTKHPAPQGAFVLCKPGTTDEFVWDRRRRTQHGFLHFDVDGKKIGLPPRDRWPVVVPPPNGEMLEPLFRYTLSHIRHGDRIAIAVAVELMLRIFVAGGQRNEAFEIETPPDAVSKAIDHLHQALEADASQPITLDDLAAAACVTPEHLCRLFKRATGRSPMMAVRLARLDRASTLLTRTNFSIGQIAELCGFASQFHFARLFRAGYGCTPSALRQNVRSGKTPPVPLLIAHRRPPEDQKQA